MSLWRNRRFEITVAFLCMVVYSNLPLSSAVFGWLQGKRKVAYLDRDTFNGEKTGEGMAKHSLAKRGPDGCGPKLKTALGVVKAYGASFRHWHWPWRKKKKTVGKNARAKKQRSVDEQLRIIDHCAAIAEREEYQRGHFGQRRRQRRWARWASPRDMDDKSALKTLRRILGRKNRAISTADHWTNIGLIRWGRRTIRGIRRPAAFRSAMITRQQKKKNGNVRKTRNKNGKRRAKRGDDEEEEEEGGGRSSSDEEDGNGTKFKYTKRAHGYSGDKNAGSNANDKIYEAVSFEAEHPEKGRYTQRTMTEYKFHGPKHSEWRRRPPKPPKADEGRAWTGKFTSRRGTKRHWANRRHKGSRGGTRKSRRGRWKRKKNLTFDDYGIVNSYTVAHLPPMFYSYGHYYDYDSPWWNTYSGNYGDGAFGYGGDYAVEESDGGFMPSGGLGAALKMLAVVLFVMLLIIII